MTTWLITSTFYGQWLPGDERGSVTNVRDRRPGDPDGSFRIEHAAIGEAYDEHMPGLYFAAQQKMKGPPVALDLAQAEQLLEQFQETATYRKWELHAVSIMFNHVHLVVEAPPAIGKSELLRDFKSYGSRRLNHEFGRRESGTWWSDGGSCRPVRHVPSAIFYVCHRQPCPLVIWSRERGRIPPSESHPDNVYRDPDAIKPPGSEPPASEPPA
jgi:REP element-mobilizing transposase RayT